MTDTRMTRIRRSVASPGRFVVEVRSGSIWRMAGTVFRDGDGWWGRPSRFYADARVLLGPFRLRREATTAVAGFEPVAGAERKAA